MATQGQISQIAGQMPVASGQLEAQQRAARDIQLQQMVGAAAPTQATAKVAQQAATQIAGQAGAEKAAAVQEQAGALSQLQGIAGNLQKLKDQREISDREVGLAGRQIDMQQRLSNLDLSAKREMFDSRMKFAEDELGRKFGNERQLADWKRMNARSVEEMKEYEQKMSQLSQRSQYMSKVALQKVTQEITLTNAMINQLQDQVNNVQIGQAERENAREILQAKLAQKLKLDSALNGLKESLLRKQAIEASRATRNQALFQVAGAVGGGVVGGIYGGPAGAAAGATAGSQLGAGLGSLTNV